MLICGDLRTFSGIVRSLGGALLGLAAVALVGCATATKTQEASVDSPRHPPLSVTFSLSDPQLLRDCLGYSERHAVNHCTLNMLDLSYYWKSLNDSHQFQKVLYNSDNSDYQLAITTAYYSEEGVRDIAMSYLSGLTFTLYPLTTHHEVKATLSLMWRDKVLKRYHYRLPFDRKVRLYYPGDDSREFVDELLARFMNDAEADSAFSEEFLYSVLNASDYSQALGEVAQLDKLRLKKQKLSPNPYRGLHLQYELPKQPEGQFEVYVYPVARTDWSDLNSTLLEEELRIRHSQADVVVGDLLGSIDYADSIFVLFESELNLPMRGLLFRGEILTSFGQRLVRDTYLFLKEDKFIQARVTCPNVECLEQSRSFARNVARRFEAPPESEFMADLRQRHRRISLRR